MTGHRKEAKVKWFKGAIDAQQPIKAKGIKCKSAEVTSLAVLTVPFADWAAVGSANRLVDAGEDDGDVKEVYSNAEISG